MTTWLIDGQPTLVLTTPRYVVAICTGETARCRSGLWDTDEVRNSGGDASPSYVGVFHPVSVESMPAEDLAFWRSVPLGTGPGWASVPGLG